MIAFWFPDGIDEFEYDLRGLLTSFYPGSEPVKLSGEPEETEGFSLLYRCPAFPEIRDKTERKNATKRAIYRELSELTGKTLPWGTLTGIRPTKLVLERLEEGWTEEEIRRFLSETYLVGEEKQKLALTIAKNEKRILSGIDFAGGFSLYAGIPFCPSRCLYCSFASYPADKFASSVDRYLETLFYELEQTAGIFRGKAPDSVYIGGGTPTALSAEQLDRLLGKIEDCYDLSRLREFTVEAGRPDSITREKLRMMKTHPVSRISVNPQSMNEETLRLIGRRHTVEELKNAYYLAREEGFDNINMDIILGLPGEGPEEVEETLRQIEEMKPDSLTVHSLAVKRASRLKMEANGAVIPGPGQTDTEAMMRASQRSAAAMGMEPYYLYRQKNMAGNLENTGYAVPGKEGIYNILMMEEKQSIAACGAGTVSKAVHPDGRIERADDVKDLKEYIERIEEMTERKRKLWL